MSVSPSAESLKSLMETSLLAAGCAAEEAEVVADHLVRANLKGHDSHGAGLFAMYANQLARGTIVPNSKPTIVTDTGTMLIMDAGPGPGQAVARAAMHEGVARAKEHGICMLGLRCANHIGRIGTYGEIATASGLVSMHFVNVYNKIVAPHGGTDQRFGTNPICLAVPGTPQNPGVQLDMATSIGAMGKVGVAFRAGKEMPAGWLVDADGQPTVRHERSRPPICWLWLWLLLRQAGLRACRVGPL